jgi:hypothetical protein
MMSTACTPIIEFRESSLVPKFTTDFVELTTSASKLYASISPLRLFCMPDTGGHLNVAMHAYYYAGGYQERDDVWENKARDSEWQSHLQSYNSFLEHEKSQIFVESSLVSKIDQVQSLISTDIHANGDKCIFEIRRYNLILGYDTVPKFLELYEAGLPSKLCAEGTDPTTSLITLMYSEVGRLNEVIEIWRHGDGVGAMERSRVAARGASLWRKSISEIAPLAIQFTSTICKPLAVSPMN